MRMRALTSTFEMVYFDSYADSRMLPTIKLPKIDYCEQDGWLLAGDVVPLQKNSVHPVQQSNSHSAFCSLLGCQCQAATLDEGWLQ